MDTIFLQAVINGLLLGGVYAAYSAGFSLIFGVMGVVNLAHGEFMAMGAYTVYLCSQITQTYIPTLGPFYFLFAIVAAFFVAGFAGLLVEWSLIRFLLVHAREEWSCLRVLSERLNSLESAEAITLASASGADATTRGRIVRSAQRLGS